MYVLMSSYPAQTDMCLGLLKKIQKVRSDLRIIVASATLDAQFFKDFFEQNMSSDSEKEYRWQKTSKFFKFHAN